MASKWISLSAIALSFAIAQTPALACGHMGKEDWLPKLAEKLDLTTEQKVKIKMYAQKAKIDLMGKRNDLKDIRHQINEAFRASSITEAKVDEFASQEEKVFGAMAKTRLHERYDIYSVLNDKQKEKMNQLIKKWEEKHKKD